jgi:hypothetical protein
MLDIGDIERVQSPIVPSFIPFLLSYALAVMLLTVLLQHDVEWPHFLTFQGKSADVEHEYVGRII